MPFPSSVQLSSLDGDTGFRIDGSGQVETSGRSVAAAGDVNGDGFDDVIIGAYRAYASAPSSGSSFVVFGSSAGFDATIELSALDGINGFRIDGASGSDASGRSVSGAGDVNGDGFDDIIIGAKGAAPNGDASGASYVVFGRSGGFAAALNLSALDGSNGFRIDGASADDASGHSVSDAGDVNGDGFDDVIIGAPYAAPYGPFSGSSYVVFGSSAGFGAAFQLSALDGSNGFKLNGEAAYDMAGIAVHAAGDVNGDGIDDVIVGAIGATFLTAGTGSAYVVFGRSDGFSATIEASAIDGSNGFRINGEYSGDQAGTSVGAAGDVNGDGIDDILIGVAAPGSQGPGQAYVVFGTTAGFPVAIEASRLDGGNGFRIDGASSLDRAGFAVHGAGDVNGDGIDDILIGAFKADPNGYASGAGYVVFGRSTGFASTLQLAALDGSSGFAIQGQSTNDYAGSSVSAAGDVNGDGIDDIIVGAPGSDANGYGSGASYVIFGSPPLPPPAPPLPPSFSNSPPVAGADAFTLPWQTKLTVQGPGLLGNDTDADGNPLTVTGLVSGPAHGTLVWSPDGGFIYQPNAAYVGPDGFTYQVGDGRGGFDTAQVRITVADDEQPDPVWPIDGGFGNERLSGSNQADTIRGNDGDDTITGDGGRDRLEGNAGNDSILGQGDEDIAWGGQGNDVLDGGQGNDWVLGDRGNDTVHGGAGHDFVWGGQGDDQVFGDGGHDMLSGDRGNDTLTGGEGADRFIFKEGGGLDLVTDFTSVDGDRILIDTGGDGILNGLSLDSFADLLARMVDTPGGVFLSLGDPDHGVTIAGITRDQLTAGDFQML